MLLLWGRVGSQVATPELRFEDGTIDRLPIAHGFALYQVDPRDFRPGHRPIALIAKTADGGTVARGTLGPWGRRR